MEEPNVQWSAILLGPKDTVNRDGCISVCNVILRADVLDK
jgi:hypothetical protein